MNPNGQEGFGGVPSSTAAPTSSSTATSAESSNATSTPITSTTPSFTTPLFSFPGATLSSDSGVGALGVGQGMYYGQGDDPPAKRVERALAGVPTFDGTRSIESFLEAIEFSRSQIRVGDDGRYIYQLLTKLKGDAVDQVRPLLRKATTINQVVSDLRALYGRPETVREIQSRMKELYQMDGESAAKFGARILAIKNLADDKAERTARSEDEKRYRFEDTDLAATAAFITGLKPNLYLVVSGQSPATLAEAIEFARAAEIQERDLTAHTRRRENELARKKNAKVNLTTEEAVGSLERTFRQWDVTTLGTWDVGNESRQFGGGSQGVNAKANDGNNASNEANGTENATGNESQVVCYNCGTPGHLTRDYQSAPNPHWRNNIRGRGGGRGRGSSMGRGTWGNSNMPPMSPAASQPPQLPSQMIIPQTYAPPAFVNQPAQPLPQVVGTQMYAPTHLDYWPQPFYAPRLPPPDLENMRKEMNPTRSALHTKPEASQIASDDSENGEDRTPHN